jgi:hypothetical protein
MTPEIFAEWLVRQGYRVMRTPSSYWFNQGPRVYQAFPYHWVIEPSRDEVLDFLRRYKAVGLRYSTPLEQTTGAISYHAVYDKPTYGLEQLSKWSRKNVRRGLKNCRVEPISFEQLAEEGWRLQLDTLARQGRQLHVDKLTWCKRCWSAADLPGFEAWGAFAGDQLAASVITFQMEDCVYMLYQQCLREYLEAHVNNALSFMVTQTMLGRLGISLILYGLHSLDAPASIDEFKFRMGYTARPVRQRVVFHPMFAPLVNRASHGILKQLRRWRPGNPTLAKMEGMMRFYLEGNYPLDRQIWPAVLKAGRPVEVDGDA